MAIKGKKKESMSAIQAVLVSQAMAENGWQIPMIASIIAPLRRAVSLLGRSAGADGDGLRTKRIILSDDHLAS